MIRCKLFYFCKDFLGAKVAIARAKVSRCGFGEANY
jgi:hypothetical protein